MKQHEYSIRNIVDGEEEIKAKIFNEVMLKINSDISPTTSEEIKIRNPVYGGLRYREEFTPENTKMLVYSNNEVVGFAECNSRLGTYNLGYPLILNDHRSSETLNLLFRAIYDFSRSNNAKRMSSTYDSRYKPIHEFFRDQKIAKIKETRETRRLVIPTEQLNYEITGFEFVPFTQDKIEELVAFRHSKEGVAGRDMSKEELEAGFKSGKYSPENSTLIYRNGRLVAWWSVRINSPPYDYDKTLKHSIGVLNEFAFDTNYENITELRKAAFKTGYQYLKAEKIPEFRIWAVYQAPFYNEFENYGFKLTGEAEFVYEFE